MSEQSRTCVRRGSEGGDRGDFNENQLRRIKMYGLYIHIPFCIKKCRYCDFTSFSGCESIFDNYIETLLKEARQYSNLLFDTVFIGGGTPTILPPHQLKKLISGIKEILQIKEDAEISIEANPKTLNDEKLSLLKEQNINRLSIGVQSFSDSELEFLGRVHCADDAYHTVELAKKYFDNLNIDLMFALPGQSEESVLNSVKTALSLKPSHLSCYSLILEEGTDLYSEYEKGILVPQDEDTDRNNFDKICKTLKQSGYTRYEISNFAIPGYECRHNLKYWNCDEYIGLGVAAHSYFNGKRFYNTDKLEEYLNGHIKDDEIELSLDDKISEFMIMGLRKTNGINIEEFNKRFKCFPYDKFNIKKFETNGLIINDGKNIYLSEHGLDVSNSILCEFV